MKYYAVKNGKIPGIYKTWDECKKQVNGYSGAEYKSFPTEEEAKRYVMGEYTIIKKSKYDIDKDECNLKNQDIACKEDNKSINKKNITIKYIGAEDKKSERKNNYILKESSSEEVLNCKDNEIIAYVDGSYRHSDRTFSYGAVLFNNDIYETASERFYNEDATMRNVSGEIRGSMYAMKRAIELGKDVLYIHYDYAGIEKWALGLWKRNKEGTIAYKKYYDSVKDKLKVQFIKVKAHSGVEYNEVVDKLAKEAK